MGEEKKAERCPICGDPEPKWYRDMVRKSLRAMNERYKEYYRDAQRMKRAFKDRAETPDEQAE